MTEEGLKGLATTYNTCAPIQMTTNEIANLMSTLAGSFDGVVQCVDCTPHFIFRAQWSWCVCARVAAMRSDFHRTRRVLISAPL
jgi:hypothetical protein